MKLIQILRGAALCSALSFLTVSCKKEDTSFTTPNKLDVQTFNERFSGVIPDDPARVAKVPMIISAQFLQESRLALSADPLAITGSFYTQLSASKGAPGDRTKPVVSIISPTSGSTVSGTVTIQVSATDNVGVTQVSVDVDGSLLATGSTAPYNFSWNTSAATSGTHTITATAKDAAGNSSAISTQVGINVAPSGDITAPTVSITSPASGSSFTAGATVSVGVSASDNVGVSSVVFSVDGTLQNTLTAAPYNFSWNSAGVASGTHTLMATAKDAAGNTSSYSILVTVNTTVISSSTLSSSYQLLMPPVRDQGSEGSCVSFASGYYARSAEQYYKTGASTYSNSNNVFSPEYLFDQTKTSADCSGSALINALNFLVNTGICTWQSLPYSSTDGCALTPTTQQNTEAFSFKISSYSAIYASDVQTIKTMVSSNHPIITPVSIDANFYQAGPGYIWNSFSGYYNSHVITICGYDDAKHAYKAINSWGTTWGDQGFIWIDYDFLSTVCYQVYKINT